MNPLRVGIDTSALDPHFKEHAQRGIGRYVRELKMYFDGPRRADDTGLVTTGYFDHTDFRAGRILDQLIQRAPLGRETIRQQLIYPIKLRGGVHRGFDVLHFPAQMDAPSWSPMPYLITVLDLIPIICRDLYQTAQTSWRFKLARWLELRAIQNAQRVLVISENTGRDVNRLLGVPWERISVTPLGVNRDFFRTISESEVCELTQRLAIDRARPSVLYVGGIDQRKNCAFMLRAVAELCSRCRASAKPLPQLVLAGKISRDRQYPALKKLIEQYQLNDVVKEVGFVADGDLATLYRSCSLFFFPSLYEGFGLPPLEALATGSPVLSSHTSAMPEVLGEFAEYTDPADVGEAARKLYELLFLRQDTEELREKRRQRAALFTWEKTGEKTREAYQQYARGLRGVAASRAQVPVQTERL